MDSLPLPTAVRREPASVELTRQLMDYLLSGPFRPGAKIPSERQLAKSLSIGRAAVRDGLRPLVALGLLDVRVGDGTYLNNPDIVPKLIEWGMLVHERRIFDLIEARGYFETVTAGLAAERRTDEAIVQLYNLVNEMRFATSAQEFSRVDTAFHLYIAEVSGNTVLSGMLQRIQALLRVWIFRVLEQDRDFERSYNEHVPIARAIEARDRKAAEKAMGDHLSGATARLRATLGRESGEVHPEPSVVPAPAPFG